MCFSWWSKWKGHGTRGSVMSGGLSEASGNSTGNPQRVHWAALKYFYEWLPAAGVRVLTLRQHLNAVPDLIREWIRFGRGKGWEAEIILGATAGGGRSCLPAHHKSGGHWKESHPRVGAQGLQVDERLRSKLAAVLWRAATLLEVWSSLANSPSG